MKTVRFSEVVKRSGKPAAYALWTKPERDPEFKRAVEKNRVMTVHQENRGGKKDYGVVGFTKDPHAELLVFPKSLQPFAGKRTVGVRYDLLTEAPKTKRGHRDEAAEKPKKFPVFRSAPKEDSAEEPKRPFSKETPKPSSPTPTSRTKKPAHALANEVRHALVELKKGQAVAAYQRLEKALKKEDKAEGKRIKE